MTNSQKENINKIILYLIAVHQAEGIHITVTKLHKLLYFMDFGNYALHRKSITGLNYLKFKHGPVPFGVDTLLKSMEENGVISKQWMSDDYDGHYIFKTNYKDALNEIDANKEQKDVIVKTVKRFKSTLAVTTSKKTHYHFSWVSTKNGKIIPYKKAKYCDFEWLGYFYDKSEDDFEEMEKTRELFNKSSKLNHLFSKIQKLEKT